MGLFKKQDGEAAGAGDALSPAEALAGIAMCAMYADGVMSAEEDDELALYLADLAVFRALSDREMSACFQRVQRLAEKSGDAGLLDAAAAALPERLRPAAFLVAADLVMSDGETGDDERAFLRRVQASLKLDEATAAKILEVLAYKHAA